MKIYDISQEVLSCAVFGGDPAPKARQLMSMEEGAHCTLSSFSMCAHNGTHVDAPAHFIRGGATVGELSLTHFVGPAYVAAKDGVVTAQDAERMLARAAAACPDSAKRILVKGKAELSLEAARVFAQAGILLFGNESQTVGPESAPREVHLLLLGKRVVLLEGIRLCNVEEGVYLLNAAPLNLASLEGAPCRAILMQTEECG